MKIQDDIKHSKEQCNKDNKDEVQEKTATLTKLKKNACVCDMYSNICNQNVFKKKYPGRAHWALVKFVWKNVQK